MTVSSAVQEGPPVSGPSCGGRLEVLAAVVTDRLNEEVERPRRWALLPAVEISSNEMARADEASVEGEELEVVRRRRVWVAWYRSTMAGVAAYGPRRARVKETSPTGSHQLIRRHALRRRPSDRRERD